MSNQQVGPVFEKVIQEVCDASQVDFEESGVDQRTLLDLREAWQQKLSSVNVAHFPWDPAPPQPAPQPSTLPQATVPSNAPRPLPQPQHVPPPGSLPHSVPPPVPTQAQAAMSGPRIKAEAGTNGQPGLPSMNSQVPMQIPGQAPNPQAARDRAASHLQNKFGAAASHSVSQLQSHGQAPHPYTQMHAANNQVPQLKQESTHPPMGPGQTDGVNDALDEWNAEVKRNREAAQNGQGDRILREHFNQQMRSLEAGGLFRPVTGKSSSSSASRRAAASLQEAIGSEARSSAPKPQGQFDGVDEVPKVEADEDAINSDLDDPDDLVAEDGDADEADGQVMLCTYDKVQRVKNKWKCTLKDGILTTSGKEYVFHKGQGEFEW